MRDINSPIAPSSSRVVPIRVRVVMQRWMGKCRMQMPTEVHGTLVGPPYPRPKRTK